jgi:hypothetical protein
MQIWSYIKCSGMEPLLNSESVCTPKIRNILQLTLERINAQKPLFSSYLTVSSSLMKRFQYSNKHHHPVPPIVLHPIKTAGQLSCINTTGTKSVYVCVRLLTQLTALKAQQILSLFATA